MSTSHCIFFLYLTSEVLTCLWRTVQKMMEPEPKILKPARKGTKENQSTEYTVCASRNQTPCDFCRTLEVPLTFESTALLSTPQRERKKKTDLIPAVFSFTQCNFNSTIYHLGKRMISTCAQICLSCVYSKPVYIILYNYKLKKKKKKFSSHIRAGTAIRYLKVGFSF